MSTAQDLIKKLNAFTTSYQADPDSIDRDTRVQLQQAASKAFRALEDGYDLSRRILCESPAEQLTIRIGCDLKIFPYLREEQPQTVEKLNEKIKIEPTLLARTLQALAGYGALRKTPDGYVLTPGASNFAQAEFAQCFGVCQDWLLPVYQALPKKLRAEHYKLPQTDPSNLALQYAWDERGKGLFEIFAQRSDVANGFRQLVATWGLSGSLLFDYYPVEERLVDGFDPDISDVMFVDIGGNWGQKSIAVKDRFPQIPGRFIVQDLSYAIESAQKTDKVELTVHDFFQPQQIKDPRTFYIRQTLHNWSDDDVLKIFGAVAPAMKAGYTRFLLHELVLPEQEPSPWVVTQDISMMTQLGTKERTEHAWRGLVEKAGLSVARIYYAKDGISESVIEVEKK